MEASKKSSASTVPQTLSPSVWARPPVANARLAVEIFDGTGHFGMWQSEVLDALFQQGLDAAIEEQKPEEVEEKDWKTMNRLACGTIRSCLSREQRYAFSKETSARTLWMALEEKFLKKNSQNKLFMKKRLFRFTYTSGTTMNAHITSFNQLVTDLLNMDESFKDEDLALMLLASLPEEFEFLETTLLHGKADVTLSEVCAALYSYELRRKDKQEGPSGEFEALIARGRPQQKKSGKKGRSKSRPGKDECAFCREKGHWKKDCPKLKNKGKPDKGKSIPESNVADCEDSEYSLATSATTSRGVWILDSGCSYHMCPHQDWFFDLKKVADGVIYTADDTALTTLGIGSVRLKNQDGSIFTLTGVRYVPKLTKNLISVGILESKGFEVRSKDGVMKIISGARVVLKGTRQKNNLYYYLGNTEIGVAATTSIGDQSPEAFKLWHMRLGHAGEKSLNSLINQGLLKGVQTCKLDFCEHCTKGKQTRVKFGTAIHKTEGIMDYVHSDVWGPSKTSSLGGKHYYVTFVDDYSRRVWVYTMKKKDEVFEVFVKWKKMMETQTNRRIKCLRTDNGGEYKNHSFSKLCEDEGIKRHFTVKHTPQQNGVAERMNRTLLEKVRCMLSNAGLGKEFWAEAVTYACQLINRLPSAAIDGKTPFEKWYGKPATDYESLHVFGSTVYYHVKESKLDPRAKKAVFMGISSGVKGYRLWCPETKKILFSRDVTFDESSMLKKEDMKKSDGVSKQVEFDTMMIPADEVDPSTTEGELEGEEEEEVQAQELPQQFEPIALRKPQRIIRRPARFDDMVAYALPIIAEGIPTTFTEAIHSSDEEKWRMAMDEEMQSLQKNQTWRLTSLPEGKKAIGCKWVYTMKDGFPDKDDVRYKARLVVKGYAQKEGVDYNEVFSPVVKHSSIRILLALVAQLDLELVQMDVKTAFLHGDLKEEIYMTQPDGFKVAGKEDQVCKLEKSLYGLKQSPRQWYKRFDKFMMGQKYTRSKYDNCVYFRKLSDGSFIYLLLYVDDMLIASKSQTEIEKLKTQLKGDFEMKDLGEARKILGMEITRDRKLKKLSLTQKDFLKKVLKRFGMNESSKPVSTPLAPHFKLDASMSPKDDADRKYMLKVPYANVVGSLMYAMVCTRPDISQAVGVVSRYMHDPGEGHWKAVKWILRYIQNTVDVGLIFEQDNNQFVTGYCDSDFAGDLDKRRSTTGYIFTLAKAPVSWKSTLQSTVALSTTEAEYMAITEAVKEAIWLQGLLGELGVTQKYVKVFCDSQSAIQLAKNQVYHARTKHIDVRHHFVREIIEEGGVRIEKIHTSENPADMMTKVVTAIKFQHCLNLIHISKA